MTPTTPPTWRRSRAPAPAPSDRIILVCGEGNRSARAADALANEHGFTNVASIIGGSKLWSDLGYPIEGEIAIGDEEAETHLEGEEDTT